MSDAIFNTDPTIVIDKKKLEYLKYKASTSICKRFRLCLHHTTNALVNEMIIAFCRETYNRPHRHPVDKTESYHIISGVMNVLIFDNYGEIIDCIKLGDRDSGYPFLFHMQGGIWHMPVPESEYVVTHETFTGPFQRDIDVEFASWSPEEGKRSSVLRFLNKIKKF